MSWLYTFVVLYNTGIPILFCQRISMNYRFDQPLPTNFSDDSFHMEILKESLVRALHDIGFTFSKESTVQFKF